MPFVFTHGFILLSAITNIISGNPSPSQELPEKKEVKLWPRFIRKILLSLVLLFILMLKSYSTYSEYWLLSGYALAFFLVAELQTWDYFKQIIPKQGFRIYVLGVIISSPIISFTLGKMKGIEFYNNNNVRYINPIQASPNKNISNASDSSLLKFLGFLGDKVIISTLDNKKIIVLNQSDYPGFEIQKPK